MINKANIHPVTYANCLTNIFHLPFWKIKQISRTYPAQASTGSPSCTSSREPTIYDQPLSSILLLYLSVKSWSTLSRDKTQQPRLISDSLKMAANPNKIYFLTCKNCIFFIKFMKWHSCFSYLCNSFDRRFV